MPIVDEPLASVNECVCGISEFESQVVHDLRMVQPWLPAYKS
jgi:hypothetical protein